MTGQWKWPVCLSRLCLTDGTRRQNLENGPSACPVSQEARQIQTLLSCLSDPAEDFLQAVHCALHCSPCMILYTKQQIKNGCILPHKNFISSVSFNALYTMCVLHTISTVCLPVLSVGHYTGGTGTRAIFKVLSACPVCQTQTGQADWWFSLSHLSRHVLVRPKQSQTLGLKNLKPQPNDNSKNIKNLKRAKPLSLKNSNQISKCRVISHILISIQIDIVYLMLVQFANSCCQFC